MSHSWIRISLGLLAAVLAGQAAEAEAQVVRLRRGAGLVVGAPFVGPVRIGIGPIVPRVVVGLPVRPALPLRRGLYLPPPAPAGVAAAAVAPRYAPGVAVAARAARPASAPPSATPPRWPTPQELASLDDAELLNVVLAATATLDDELGRFQTAASWRRYLRLPDAALPPAVDGRVELGLPEIAATLDRFDSVAANPEYSMIAGAESFGPARDALAEVVRRFAGASAAPPATPGEELPLPPPALAAPASNPTGERSILAR